MTASAWFDLVIVLIAGSVLIVGLVLVLYGLRELRHIEHEGAELERVRAEVEATRANQRTYKKES